MWKPRIRCAECDEDVNTKCEDGHPLTPYRVTFSTEDAEKSPAVGLTPATGGTSLSPLRSPGAARSDTAAAAAAAGAAVGAVGAVVALEANGGGGGGGAAESPGVLSSGNGSDAGGRQQQQQQKAPRMRDSRGGGDENGVGRGAGAGVRGEVVVATDENGGSVGAAANPAAGLGRVSAPSSLPPLSPPTVASNSTAEGVLRETERRPREAEAGRGGPGALVQGVGDGGCAAMQTAPSVDVGGGEGQTTAAVTVVAAAAAVAGAPAGGRGA